MSPKYQTTRNFVILFIISLVASLGWFAVSSAQQSANGFGYAHYMPLIRVAVASPTPTPTISPGCQIVGASLAVFNNQLTFPITNQSSQNYKIQSIYLSWPETETQALDKIEVQARLFGMVCMIPVHLRVSGHGAPIESFPQTVPGCSLLSFWKTYRKSLTTFRSRLRMDVPSIQANSTDASLELNRQHDVPGQGVR
jgi:hypothetical protein